MHSWDGVNQGEPNPVTLMLLDRLVHLEKPPHILYLVPLASPLPPALITILQTMKTSAQEFNSAAGLTCEPLPRHPEAIEAFMRKWAVEPAGTGEGGRRIDAVVWTDDWTIKYPLAAFRSGDQDRGDSWKKAETEDAVKDKTPWTVEESRFHLLTALLPFLLRAPLERDIRLVNLVSPFYAAAIPSQTADGSLKSGSGKDKTSPILESGTRSWRAILLWSHVQKVLDALATANDPVLKAVPVPETELPDLPSVANELEKATSNDPNNGADARRLPGPEDGISVQPAAHKKISVQSNVSALSVVMPFNRYGVLRPLLGFSSSRTGFEPLPWESEGALDSQETQTEQEPTWIVWILYTLLSPLIYLFTPGTSRSIEPVLFALSAPILYDQDVAAAKAKDGTVKEEADKPAGVPSSNFQSTVPMTDHVRGGGLVRGTSCWARVPTVGLSRVDALGRQVWEDCQAVVEERVGELKKKRQQDAGGAAGASVGQQGLRQRDVASEKDEIPEDVYA